MNISESMLAVGTVKDSKVTLALLSSLQNLYSVETQLVNALPGIIKAVSNVSLKSAIAAHLEQTKEHVKRLDQVFHLLVKPIKSTTCVAMKQLISDGGKICKSGTKGHVKDVAIIGAAMKVEQYEIACYLAAIKQAQVLNSPKIVSLLTSTLHEEQAASKKLSAESTPIMKQM